MADIINLRCVTTLDLPPDRVLSGAMGADLKAAVVIGYGQHGDLYLASSYSKSSEVILMIELLKAFLMRVELAKHFAQLADAE